MTEWDKMQEHQIYNDFDADLFDLRVEAKKLFKEFNRTEDEETELRQQFSSAFALETIIGQYTFGTPEGSVGPDGYSLDYYYVNLPGRAEMQNDLISRKPSYGNCAADERILKASS